jgi:HK97 family phage portal protein
MLDTLRRFWARRRTKAPRAPAWGTWLPMTNDSGEPVTHQRALAYAAVWACVRVISESIAQLPWGVFRHVPNGRQALPYHPVHALLSRSPSPELTAAVWKECMLQDALTNGNAYCEIERDAQYRPVALHPIRADLVTPTRDSPGGELYYAVRQETGAPIPIPAADIWHLRGLGDAIQGYSVLEYHALTIGLALGEQRTHASFIRNDARPMGIITPVGPIRPEIQSEMERSWKEWTGGRNKFRTIVLPAQMEYKPLGLPNTDAQMLEGRRYSVLDICRIYRVPPHKVAELQYATFSNIVHQNMEFVVDGLNPWIIKMEQETDRKILSPGLYSKINLNALLRGDFETRVRSYQIMFDRGIFSINDILELEDRNQIGPDGDARFVPQNMIPLEQALHPPEPKPEPQPDPPAPTEEGSDDPPQPAPADLMRPAIVAAARRIRTREIDRVNAGFRAYIDDQLLPLRGVVAMATDQPVHLVADRMRQWARQYYDHARETPNTAQTPEDIQRLADAISTHLGGNHAPHE